MIKNKTLLIAFLALFFNTLIIGCGKAAPPSPIFETQSTKIQKEIDSRKEKNKDEQK